MLNLAAYIPPAAGRVAELGCGVAETGRDFRRINPNCDYWGIASDPESVREAAAHLSRALQAGPDSLNLEREGCFDADVVIIRGEFLKGMTAARLKKWASVLGEEGQVLIYAPSSGYICHLLADLGAALKEDEGEVLDLQKLEGIFDEAGLCLADTYLVRGRETKALQGKPEVQAFLQALDALLVSLGKKEKPDPWVKGHLLRLVRKKIPAEEKMMLHVLVGETVVTRRPRIQEPNAFLETLPYFRAIDEAGEYHTSLDEGFARKIFLRHRKSYDSFAEGKKNIEMMRERGYLIIHELDDNPVLWMKRIVDNHYIDYMGTHALQVSTEALADRLREMNPYVQVFRNELKELPERRNFLLEKARRLAKRTPVTIFFGALNRTREWQDIMPALNEAAHKYGDRIFFKVLSDRGFYEALETEHKIYVAEEGRDYGGQFVSYESYCRAMHTSDISLLPLHDTEFNRTKSDLKFIESAAHGAVILASPTVYENTVREGRTGFIYRSPQEFAEKLRLLIEDEARRIETAEAAYAYVKSERLLCQHYQERAYWYSELWNRREELDKALLERLAKVEEIRKKAKGDGCD